MKSFFVICVVMFSTFELFAQSSPQSISTPAADPLQKLREDQNSFVFYWSVSYEPGSSRGPSYDDTETQVGFYQTMSHSTGLYAGGSYSMFRDRVVLGLSAAPTFYNQKTEYRDFNNNLVMEEHFKSDNFALSPSLSLRFYQSAESEFRLAFSTVDDDNWTAGLSAAHISDPAVLDFQVNVNKGFDYDMTDLGVSTGAGLIANERVSFSVTSGYNLPLNYLGVPVFTVALQLRYALDARSTSEVLAGNSLAIQEGYTSHSVYFGSSHWIPK